MSHFAVLVIGPDVEGQLAPYQENNMGDCPREFMEFEDHEDEWRKDYEEGTQERIVMPDKRLLLPWDSEFKQKDPKDPLGILATTKPPDEYEKRQVPNKELYPTFEAYVEEWHGQKERDAETGHYGYWHNPNTKWDWWEIGGRWSGFFKMKPGKKGLKGGRYNIASEFKESEKADVARKGDIDWAEMRREAAEDAGRDWDFINEIIKDLPVAKSWEEVLEDFGLNEKESRKDAKNHEKTLAKAREFYWAQERVKACRSEKVMEVLGFLDGVEKFQVSREEFCKRASERVGVPFAVVANGKWFEKGRMGWWGITTDEKDTETWNSMFHLMINDLNDDTILTVVDCHI